MFQYDEANRGYNPGVTGPKEGVTKRWSYDTGREIRSSPAILDETVYIGAGNRFYAFDVVDGSKKWHIDADGPVDASPAVVDRLAYFLSDAGTVYAVDGDSGAVHWQKATQQEIPAETPRTSSPTAVDGAVYVGLHAGGVWSFDGSTGEKRWETKLDGAVIGAAPPVADNTLFTGHTGGALVAIDTDDGTIQWRTKLAEFVTCPPTVHEGRVYVGGSEGRVHEVSASSGDVERTFETAFEPDLPGTPLRKINASPAIADGSLVVGSNDYHAYAWDLDSGDRQWRFRVGGRCYSAPAIADGVAYVGGISGQIYGIELTTGEQLWSYAATGEIRDSSPAVVNNAICIGDSAGELYCLEARTI